MYGKIATDRTFGALAVYFQHKYVRKHFITPEMFGCISGNSNAADRDAEGWQKVIAYASRHGQAPAILPSERFTTLLAGGC